jgi:hypothetical protein
MGLLMSDAMPLDPMIDDLTWLRNTVRNWDYAMDSARDTYEYEMAEPTE